MTDLETFINCIEKNIKHISDSLLIVSSTYTHPSLVRNIFETSIQHPKNRTHKRDPTFTPVGRTVVEYSLLVDLSLLVWWSGVGLTGTRLPPLFQLTLNILQEIVKA